MKPTDNATPRPWALKRAVGATQLQRRLEPEVLSDIAIYPVDSPRVIAEVFYRTGENGYEPVEANAALIVRAVNRDHLFERLVKESKAALAAMETPGDLTEKERLWVIQDLAAILKAIEEEK